MSKVAVERAEGKSEYGVLKQEANALADQIRKRAFELFLEREEADGFSLDNWFRAERDLLQVPEAHLVEKSGSFHLHVAVPGFNETNLKVTALLDALIVSAESKHKHADLGVELHLCAFGEKKLFRRFDLPASINTHKIHAKVADGLLEVTAYKLQESPPKKSMATSTSTQPFFEDN